MIDPERRDSKLFDTENHLRPALAVTNCPTFPRRVSLGFSLEMNILPAHGPPENAKVHHRRKPKKKKKSNKKERDKNKRRRRLKKKKNIIPLMNSKPFTSLKNLQEIRGLSIQMTINAAFDYRLG